MLYIYNEILAKKKNEILPFVVTWLDLESIIVSEKSQTEKQILFIIYMRNLKNNTNECTCKTETDIKQKLTHHCKAIKDVKKKKNRNRLIDIENKLVGTKGEKELGTDKLGVWD